MITLNEALARLPSARREGATYRAPCPAHGGKDRNLAIWADAGGKACFKCWSHGCSTREIVAALGGLPARPQEATAAPKSKVPGTKERIRRALRILREAREPHGTIVQDYLFGRGFTGEAPWKRDMSSQVDSRDGYSVALAIPVSIRFHPGLKHPAGAYLPAMIAAIEDREGGIVGIHRTFLKSDGTGKADVEPNKMALGRERGCAVRLGAGAPELVICEGIETGLSILQATGRHVWAALGTENLKQVELPAFVREVTIAADHDEPGLKAARAAAESYRGSGYQVQIVSPGTGNADWNDVLQR